MKKSLIIALAASAMFATPAAAQDVTGTINITGSVASKCQVVSSSPAGTTFGGLVALGELAQADGTLRTDLATAFGTAGGSALSAKVICTSAAPTISVDADPITASSVTAATGYTNTVNYQADVTVTTVGGTSTFSNLSSDSAGAATAIGSRLANTSNNVVVSASSFSTPANAILVASPNYAGKITVVIAPGA